MDLKPLKGIHHVSAITANAKGNYHFYTKILGMRLVKKTVNQDETSMYHLFYADELGNPGTDLTFFEIPMAARTHYGRNSISMTSLRVPSDESLVFWKKRFEEYQIEHDEISNQANRLVLAFRDFEGQRLSLVSDEHKQGVAGGIPWEKSPIPKEHGVVGLGPVQLTVGRQEITGKVLTDILGFQKTQEYQDMNVFETGLGGSGAEVHIIERPDIPRERAGRGSVHHVAFRVENEEELRNWVDYITEAGYQNSGFVERYYFKSLYFREPNGLLFELATDGPGFEGDESFEHLGEKLALPPYYEHKRAEIEAKLKPLETNE